MSVRIRAKDVACKDDGRPLLAGLFAVPHKASVARLIFDRRLQNLEEKRLGWARLPQGCQLCRLLVHKDESVRGSGDYLRTYLYNLAQLDD